MTARTSNEDPAARLPKDAVERAQAIKQRLDRLHLRRGYELGDPAHQRVTVGRPKDESEDSHVVHLSGQR